PILRLKYLAGPAAPHALLDLEASIDDLAKLHNRSVYGRPFEDVQHLLRSCSDRTRPLRGLMQGSSHQETDAVRLTLCDVRWRRSTGRGSWPRWRVTIEVIR